MAEKTQANTDHEALQVFASGLKMLAVRPVLAHRLIPYGSFGHYAPMRHAWEDRETGPEQLGKMAKALLHTGSGNSLRLHAKAPGIAPYSLLIGRFWEMAYTKSVDGPRLLNTDVLDVTEVQFRHRGIRRILPILQMAEVGSASPDAAQRILTIPDLAHMLQKDLVTVELVPVPAPQSLPGGDAL